MKYEVIGQGQDEQILTSVLSSTSISPTIVMIFTMVARKSSLALESDASL